MPDHADPVAPRPGSNRSTVAQAVAAALRRHGVGLTFGQSLPSAFQLAAPAFGIRQIAYRAENAGGIMADGYARMSNRVAVVTAQNGPAATLLVPPLAEALKASVPVVALVQEVPRDQADRNAFQEMDHVDLFRGVAKWIRRLDVPARADDYVDMAFTAAASGRPGPAVLLLPADVLTLDVEPAGAAPRRRLDLGRFPLDRTAPDPAAVEAAADLLANARSPLVVAGGGVHLSDAAAALAALQERCALPVATTTMGKGAVDEAHPLSVGVIGYFMGPNGATRHLRGLVDEADAVLLVGTRTNQNGTDSWTLFPNDARFVHLDVDPLEIGRTYEASVRLVGDARLGLDALCAALEARGIGARRQAARAAVERRIAEGRRAHQTEAAGLLRSDARPIRPERIMDAINQVADGETIFVADASYATIWLANYVPARRAGQRFLTPRGLAGLGWGLPLALGAKAAAPGRHVLAVAGDGAFAHCWAELETSLRMDLPVTLVVLNNQVLSYQKHAESVRFGAHTDACHFRPVDHARIAEACGCLGVRVEDPADLVPALRRAREADRTTVIDVITAPDAFPPITSFDGQPTEL
jgi:acetolactate synthase-1/2/3 large subunit